MRRPMLLAALIFFFVPYAGAASLSPENPLRGTGVVYRVVDGDTYVVNVDDKADYLRLKNAADEPDERRYLNDRHQSFRIRLFGVDTAESVHPDASRNTSRGKAISQDVEALLEGREVGFTCFGFGYYGRALCTVSLQGQDVGIWLISTGRSDYITKYGRHPYADKRYVAADRQSQ